MRKREHLVFDHQWRTVWPVEEKIHVAALALHEATRVRARTGERTECCIGGIRQLVEVPADEV